VACNVHPEALAQAVAGLVALGFRGANVTIPHKEAVIPLMDELSSAARSIGAVNTIVVQDGGRLLGENTDHVGFARPLSVFRDELKGRSALVLGAGGAARAVVYSLLHQFELESITLAARTLTRAVRLRSDLAGSRPETRLLIVPWDEEEVSSTGATLIVNTTPIGMDPEADASPLPPGAFRQNQIVYDLIYNPEQTRLLGSAEANGARCIGGMPMLLGQAAEAFRLWTGQEMPVDAVRAALANQARDFGGRIV